MTVDQFLESLDALAPAGLAESWDNVGLIVGRGDRPVSRVLVALDLREAVLDEAQQLGCELILTHHPVIFPTVSAITDGTPVGRLVLRAVEAGIAIAAAHTNLDSARGGLNDQMADMLGLTHLEPLRAAPADGDVGLGRVGRPPQGTTLRDLVTALGVAFDHPPRTFVGDPDRRVGCVALCTGSGASLIDDAVDAGADVYITGDLKYHDADRAPGLALVCVPHATVERVTLAAWCDDLRRTLGSRTQVDFASSDTDPWTRAE